MNTKNYADMSEADLEIMNKEILEETARRKQDRLTREIEELRKIAEERGYLVDEIFAPGKIASAPKYRHPTDASLTWTGKGRRPDWLNKKLSEGADLEDLRVS